MATKKQTPADEKFEKQDFDLFKALESLDKKDYGWFAALSEEQQRKFVPFMLLHWMSSVRANPLMSSYYVMSCDQTANKNMFDEHVQRHPELQWLMLCAISPPGVGKQMHQWIPHLSDKITKLKTAATKVVVQEYLEKIYKGAGQDVIKEYASGYTSQQNLKYRLAKIYTEMKLEDIELLSQLVTQEDLNQYDRESGN